MWSTHLLIIFPGPLDLLDEVTEVMLDGDVVNVRRQLPVKMFVIVRVLLENNRVPSQEIREPVGSYSTVNIQLVFVL